MMREGSDIMVDVEALKRAAAREAVKSIHDGDVLGLGSGTTVKHLIEELAKRIKSESLKIFAVSSSFDTSLLAMESGIPLTSLDEHPMLSKCFDGADKVDKDLNMIKGGGGCHTREKIIASASRTVNILIDYTKLVDRITGKYSIPIEIIPFSYRLVLEKVSEAGGVLKLRYPGSSKLGPAIGDNGGFIGDVTFRDEDDLNRLDTKLNSIPGIIEHGLFLKMADIVYVAYEKRVDTLKKPRDRE
jgi:ribose 5-phosphate isomerase A